MGGLAIVTDLYSSLKGVREWQKDRERRPVRREEIMLVTIREQRYVSEPIETNYFKFWLFILLEGGGIWQLANWKEKEYLRKGGFEIVRVWNVNVRKWSVFYPGCVWQVVFNLLKPTGYVMHRQV